MAYPGRIYTDTASHQHSQENEHFVYVTVSRSFPLQSITCQNLPANITALSHELGFRPLEVSRIVNKKKKKRLKSISNRPLSGKKSARIEQGQGQMQ